MRIALGAALLFLCACSVYKSPVRRDFEEKAPSRLATFSLPQGDCHEAGAIPVWLEREFPGRPVELLVADNDLEVRKATLGDGRVVVRSDRPLDDGNFESCHREFSNEAEWLANRATYFSALGIPALD